MAVSEWTAEHQRLAEEMFGDDYRPAPEPWTAAHQEMYDRLAEREQVTERRERRDANALFASNQGARLRARKSRLAERERREQQDPTRWAAFMAGKE